MNAKIKPTTTKPNGVVYKPTGSIQTNILNGISLEVAGIFKALKGGLTKDCAETLASLWMSRAQCINGSITVEPNSVPLQAYCNAAYKELENKHLAIIIGWWVYHCHERYARIFTPVFNKGIILTDYDLAIKCYWLLRSSGVPVNTTEEGIFHSYELIEDLHKTWSTRLTMIDMSGTATHVLDNVRETIEQIRGQMFKTKGPLIILARPNQLAIDPECGKGCIEC